MKLIEKKCPNCGAKIEFGKDDTEVKCNYCETSYFIQKDADLDSLVKNVFDDNDFILHRKMVKNISKGIIIFTVIMFIFVISAFFIIFFNAFPRSIR